MAALLRAQQSSVEFTLKSTGRTAHSAPRTLVRVADEVMGRAAGPANWQPHGAFVDHLRLVLEELLKAAAATGRVRDDVRAFDLMLAIGYLCIGVDTYPDCRARRMIDLLLAGLTEVS